MKTVTSFLGAFLIVACMGCNRSQPGGGTDKSARFTITGPTMTTSIRQGEAHDISLKLDRGSEFKQEIKVHADAPPGLKIAPSESAVKPADKGEVTLQVAAANDATPGERIIHVTGTPDTGKTTTLDVKVNVTERKENMKLTLSGPITTTFIKQGETQLVKIHLEPNPKYLLGVKLRADAPSGLKVDLSPSSTVKAAEGSDIALRITAEKNAVPGEHTIRVSGTAEGASVTPIDVKVKIIAP